VNKAFIFCLFCFLFPVVSQAQKFEIERRVSAKDIPAGIPELLEERFPERRRVKYYKEQSDQGLFFEAKFCLEKSLFSVKFFPDGSLKNIERKIPFKAIPADIAANMQEGLEGYFLRSRIVKVQEQLENSLVVGYEMEIKGKSKDHLGLFEAYFDSSGNLKNIRTIENPPNDFMFF
jgi:hypothetical protein